MPRAALLSVLLVLAACAPSAPTAAPPVAAPAAPPSPSSSGTDAPPIQASAPAVALVPPPPATATIRVHASARGKLPKRRPVPMYSNCVGVHEKPYLDAFVQVQDGHLADVVVAVSHGAEGWTFPVPLEAKSVQVGCCVSHPPVLSIQACQPLAVSILDPTGHEFQVLSDTPPLTGRPQVYLRQGAVEEYRLAEQAYPVIIGCDVHASTRSWVYVFRHPYHGVTGPDGTVVLTVPPGDFEISAWHRHHKFAKVAPASVKVADGESRDVEFVFEVP